jgi:hypothetical protein
MKCLQLALLTAALPHIHMLILVSPWKTKIRVQKLSSRPSMHEGSSANGFGPCHDAPEGCEWLA